MSTLLLTLCGSREFNRTIWPPYLYVYDDLLIYRKRSWFKVKETTISYNQISQINLIKGVFFAEVEIITTGTDDMRIRWVPKSKASQAKKIIDKKLFYAHAKHHPQQKDIGENIEDYEKSLNRLRELVERGRISEREYTQKSRELLKKLR